VGNSIRRRGGHNGPDDEPLRGPFLGAVELVSQAFSLKPIPAQPQANAHRLVGDASGTYASHATRTLRIRHVVRRRAESRLTVVKNGNERESQRAIAAPVQPSRWSGLSSTNAARARIDK
jgi:ATP-dependent helicase YprA (DUF1998 family)